jgi:hypothetical protein
MAHKLKALGLCLVAVLAMGAVVASAAQAQSQGTLTSTGPVTLRGVNEPEPAINAYTAFGTTTKCPNTVYTGHKVAETPHKFIPSGATQITITPHYGVCIGPLNVPTTVDMNGCDYVFDILETTGGGDTYGVRMTIVCPAGKHITDTFFKNAADHAAFKPFCHHTLTENAAGYLGLHITDLTNGHLTVSGAIEGITIHKTGGGILCPEETTNVGKLDLSINIEGRNEAGATTKISLSHP